MKKKTNPYHSFLFDKFADTRADEFQRRLYRQ